MVIEIETCVCGGFPVIARGTWCRPDYSVGWPGGFDDVEVLTLAGKPADFIAKKMTQRDWDDVYSELSYRAPS